MSVNSLTFDATKKTPWVILEPGKMLIVGRSISENPADFYRPIHEWVSEYVTDSPGLTVIKLGFEFINTTSIKWIYAILKEISRIPNLSLRAKISWYYEEGDEDMCDLGIILRSLVTCPFQIIEVEDIDKYNYNNGH